jgi:DNA-binding GntR family transcriptional regulator
MNTVSDLVIERVAPEETYKSKAYTALKQAITNMDIYSSPEPAWLDERQLSERLGVSRTPVREALAMLEQEGFVKSLPRRGIIVVKKTKREIVEMVQAWAALESLRPLMQAFGEAHKPREHLGEYSSANIAFHQAIIRLSGSRMLADMTDNLLLHVRGIRQITIGRDNRAERSIQDHLGVIGAIEQRDTERAERLSREHTLGLAAYVEQYGDKFFD